MPLHDHLVESARKHPGKEAVIQGDRRVSYGTLLRGVEAASAFLSDAGLRKGDRVALLMENSPEYILSYFGVLSAGGTVVPLSDQTTARGAVRVLADCGPTALVVRRKLLKVACEALPGLPSVRTVIVADPGDVEGAVAAPAAEPSPVPGIAFTSLARVLRDAPARRVPTRVADDDLAMILYTSGTTGAPKGVMLTHGNLAANASSIVQYLRLSAEDRVMVVLPFYYSYGNSLLTTHVCAGGTLVLENSFLYPNRVLEKMIREEVTGFSGVPSTFSILLNRSSIRSYSFPSLRYVTQAGGAMSPKHAQELTRVLPGKDIYIMYGQTEAAARLSYLEPAEIFRKAGSIGKAIPGVTLILVADEGRAAAPGEVGEIVARGANIMAGYWNNPDETARVLKSDGLHTGDLARMDEDGFFYVVGRKTEMIKSGAHRISPKEIEEVILELPGVHETAVIGVEDEILGEAIVAYVVAKDGCPVEAQDVLKYCRENLPVYKVPRSVVFASALPKTDSGKIRKQELSLPTGKYAEAGKR